MPKLLLNFDGVDLTGPEPVPAGVYQARVDTSKSEVRRSQSGNDVVSIAYVIENPPEYAGRRVIENYTITEKALWKLGRVLHALGVVAPGTKKFTFDTKDIHGKQCKIKVSQEAYNDRLRNRVDDVIPIAGAQQERKVAF